MNWPRGLFRIWLVGSAIWVGYWIVSISVHKTTGGDVPALIESIWHDPESFAVLAALVLGAPLLLLLLFSLGSWILRGFNGEEPSPRISNVSASVLSRVPDWS
jgi:hypothetical protein